MFTIEFYSTENDKCPVAEFLDSLPNKLGAKAIRDLDILSEKGNELREPYSKPIEGGIFELRISASRDEARIFYFFLIENKIDGLKSKISEIVLSCPAISSAFVTKAFKVNIGVILSFKSL